jgi:DNA (cytosine-5)-methyltransferase 1
MNVLSLFCGCGGLDSGFDANDAFTIRRAIDRMKHAVETYNRNYSPDNPHAEVGDVRGLLADGYDLGFRPDVIIGGPPCQDFSSAGRQVLGERAELTPAFCAVVERYRPRFFVMENVPAIRRAGAAILADITARFRAAGYGLTMRVVFMPDYDVPQSRKRFFIIGEHGGEDDGLAAALDAAKAPVRSIREYMARHPAVDMRLGGKEFVYRHPRSYARRGVFSIDELHPTVRGCLRSMPPTYRFHDGDRSKNRDEIAPPSVELVARMQTFPETYQFSDTRKNALIIGNAVPPAFSRVVAGIIAGRAAATAAAATAAASAATPE